MKGEKQNMNKFLTKVAKIFLGLSMAAGVGVAVANNSKEVAPVHAAGEETSTLTFSSAPTSGNSYNASQSDSAKASYTWTTDSTYISADNDGSYKSIHTGSSSKTCSYQRYVSGSFSDYLIKSVSFRAKSNGTSPSCAVTINGESVGSQSLTNSYQDLTINNTEEKQGGDLVINFSMNSAKKNIMVSWISVVYEAASSKTVTSITKKTAPTKTAYLSGESFDPTGLVVTLGYSDKTSEDISYSEHESDFSWTPTTITAAGNVSIQYQTYSTMKVTQAVTLATVTSVTSVASSPASVGKGGTVSPSDVTLNVGLSNGGTAVVEATSITLDTSVAGNNIQGTASYNSVGSATFYINVVEGYSLVTDASTLTAGTTFVLAHESTNTIGIGGWSSSYFTTTTISISGSTISSGTSAMVFTLEGSSGAWHIKSGDYYYGIQNSTTALRASTASGDNYSWTITINNGIATMKSAGSGARSLCYNGSANPVRYSAYTASSTYTQVRIFAIIPSASCEVTYDANGATSGNVPTDSNKYSNGDTVTVKGNTGSLAMTEYTWNGWNTSDNGSGTHYDANDTFEISGSITLYAEWVKSLDAISSISGSVSSTLSKAGTYDWDFSNISVTGTLSGVSGQDIKSYVDLTSSTAVPSIIGSCTVSITATKKSSIPGSATSLTNSSISGEVAAPKLVYSFTITQEDLLQTGISYANENAHAKSSTATCSEHDDIEIAWASNQIMKNNSDIQFQTTNGYLYNTTEIPGTITNVSVTATAQSFSVYYGNSEHPTSETTPGGKYFTVQGVGSTPKASQIVITFEVSDKPKVQLVASDINVDVADGAATPTITDGSAAVTGYTLVSDDSHIASITNDGKVQPVGYGRVIVNVTKAEDAGHIYLATTFTVTVGDHSKEVSKMEFVEKAGGSATADDGVVWTIDSGSVTENDYSDVYGINFGTNGSKISSLTLTTPADEERIIKNVVVEAMSAADGSSIGVTVGSTSFTCSKTPILTGSTTTFNFSGNTSGAITITMSGNQSSKYGVKSISVLYVGDEATSFASTFLGAIACNPSGTSKPTFTIKSGETYWSWSLLEDEFDELSVEDKAKFAKGATGVSSTITECVERYDYIVGKYYVGELDTTLISSDFMGRNPSAVAQSNVILSRLVGNNTNTIAIIVIISMVSVTAIGGYFFLRKRKENI